MLAARLAGASIFLVLVIAVEVLPGFHHSETEATRKMDAASVGVAIFPDDANSSTKLLKVAVPPAPTSVGEDR